MRRDFRVKLDFSRVYQDSRRKSLVFVEGAKILYVRQLADHIQRLFDVPRPFHLLARSEDIYCFLPFEEDVRVLENNDTVQIIPGTGIKNNSGFDETSKSANLQPFQETDSKAKKDKDSEKSLFHSSMATDLMANNTFYLTAHPQTTLNKTKESKAFEDIITDNNSEFLDNGIEPDTAAVSTSERNHKRKQKKPAETFFNNELSFVHTMNRKPKIIDSVILSGKHIRFKDDGSTLDCITAKQNCALATQNGQFNENENNLAALLNLRQSSTPMIFAHKKNKKNDSLKQKNELDVTPTEIDSQNSSLYTTNVSNIEDFTQPNVIENNDISFKEFRISGDCNPLNSSHQQCEDTGSKERENKDYEKSLLDSSMVTDGNNTPDLTSANNTFYVTAYPQTSLNESKESKAFEDIITDNNSEFLDNGIEPDTVVVSKRKRTRKRKEKKSAETLCNSELSFVNTMNRKPKIIDSVMLSGKHIRFEDDGSTLDCITAKQNCALATQNGQSNENENSSSLAALLNLRQSSTPMIFAHKKNKKNDSLEQRNELDVISKENESQNSSLDLSNVSNIKECTQSNVIENDDTVSFKVLKISKDYNSQTSSHPQFEETGSKEKKEKDYKKSSFNSSMATHDLTLAANIFYKTAYPETSLNETKQSIEFEDIITANNSNFFDNEIEPNTAATSKRKRTRKRKQNKSAETFSEGEPSFVDTLNKKSKIIDPITSSGKHIRLEDDGSTWDSITAKQNCVLATQNGQSNENENSSSLAALLNLRQSSTPITFVCKKNKTIDNLEQRNDLDVISKENESQSIIQNNDTVSFKILKMTEDYNPQISSKIVAKLLQKRVDGSYTFKIIDGKDQLKEPEGKFSLPNDDEESHNEEANDVFTIDESRIFELSKVKLVPA
ncbi:uncharacterized protein LOC106642113 isoform X2 [Copidosoma floridanum]|uniref:uncharacterized protein LOC106642113 isoform X2 n=1 Tax=Copidosoma floridanum TaxID=29053 RepID=UPI0006C9ABB1|nr:uncharacterized protein LOC106642113 isoform X2 [Copidosoma floridanum]